MYPSPFIFRGQVHKLFRPRSLPLPLLPRRLPSLSRKPSKVLLSLGFLLDGVNGGYFAPRLALALKSSSPSPRFLCLPILEEQAKLSPEGAIALAIERRRSSEAERMFEKLSQPDQFAFLPVFAELNDPELLMRHVEKLGLLVKENRESLRLSWPDELAFRTAGQSGNREVLLLLSSRPPLRPLSSSSSSSITHHQLHFLLASPFSSSSILRSSSRSLSPFRCSISCPPSFTPTPTSTRLRGRSFNEGLIFAGHHFLLDPKVLLDAVRTVEGLYQVVRGGHLEVPLLYCALSPVLLVILQLFPFSYRSSPSHFSSSPLFLHLPPALSHCHALRPSAHRRRSWHCSQYGPT